LRIFPWNRNNIQSYESEEADNKYIEEMFSLVYTGILEYLELIRLTEEEIRSLPFFSRSKVYKSFLEYAGLKSDEINKEFLEIKNFLYGIERDIKGKNFIKLDEKLRTYAYRYIPVIDNLTRLAEFYGMVPEPFIRANKKSGSFEGIQVSYKDRQVQILHLHENLTSIYRVISVE
jgi:hypothetical protein